MKILDISVDGFGNFSGLQIEGLSEAVSVIYGRNEAGKTTLLQFVRTMFYGLTPDRRQRYLPPRGDGLPGGSLRVKTATGTYQIQRRLDADAGRDPFAEDHVHVVRCDPSGGETAQQGGHALRVLLSGVDERTYRNVYAVGLREMQELATLSDTDAARHLYDLSAGLDRVSLVDVLRRLKKDREQLLCGTAAESEIFRLLNRHDQIQEQLQQVGQSLGRFHQLTSQRAELSQQIAGLEEERRDLEHRVRLAELASSLFPQWQQLQTVRQRLDKLGKVPQILPADVQQLEELTAEIGQRQQELKQVKLQRQRCRQQAATYPINDALRQQAARVEALAEQQDWIRSLDERLDQLDGEIRRRETALEEKRQDLEIAGKLQASSREERAAMVATLRGPARQMKQARQRWRKYAGRAAKVGEVRPADGELLGSAITSRGTENPAQSLNDARDRVQRLQQRVAVDEQLEKLQRQEAELKEELEELIDRQVLPSWGLAASGFAFAFGIMLLLMGILTAIYGTGWPYILIGLALVAGVVITKQIFERATEMDLKACEDALKKLHAKRDATTTTREELDAEIPPGGGPLTHQLRKAEQELAARESLLDPQEKQPGSRQGDLAGSSSGSSPRDAYQQARKQWCRTLHQLGLPANLSPRKAQQQLVAAAQLDRLKKLLQQRRQEAQQRREELSGCVKRVGELYEEVGLVPVHPRLTDQVQQLSRASAEQQEWIERRSTLLKESHQHRRQQLTILRQLHKWHHRRRQLLENAEAESADEFRELAGMYAESVTLKERRKRIKDQLGAAICGVCQPPELAEQMKGATAPQLERRWEKLAAKLEEVDQQLKEAFEKRGRLTEQLRSLADDRRGGQQRLELNCVRQQFREAVSRWRQLAVISCLLQSIRRRYEEERQPATLCEASQYLKQLTDGRYHRIWTLLDEDALCVDDQHGHSLTPENLSRGTREQLFLALRMALVTQYAQRGVQLPLVLDDVLVNFDSHRAQAAAAVLLDFARLGHQVLIFTCHEHLLEIFGSLGSDTRRLPGEGPPPMATPARKSHRRKKKPLPAAVPAPAPAVETEPRPQPSSAKASSATPPSAKTSSKRGSSKRGPARKQKQTPAEPAPASPVSPPQIAQPVLTAERSAGEENTWEVDDEELRQVPSTLSPHDAARPADTPLDSPPGRSQEPPTKITEAA